MAGGAITPPGAGKRRLPTSIATQRCRPSASRDKHGRVARSGHANAEFKQRHSCPSTGTSAGTRPGYVIDYVTGG